LALFPLEFRVLRFDTQLLSTLCHLLSAEGAASYFYHDLRFATGESEFSFVDEAGNRC